MQTEFTSNESNRVFIKRFPRHDDIDHFFMSGGGIASEIHILSEDQKQPSGFLPPIFEVVIRTKDMGVALKDREWYEPHVDCSWRGWLLSQSALVEIALNMAMLEGNHLKMLIDDMQEHVDREHGIDLGG